RCLRIVATWMYRASLRNAHCVFFQNQDDRRTFSSERITAPRARVEHVHGSGVDVEHFAQAGPAPTMSFLMIARLLRDKGIFEYATAARLLRQRYPNVPCRLVGTLDSNPSSVDAAQLHAWEQEGVVQYLGELRDVRPAL